MTDKYRILDKYQILEKYLKQTEETRTQIKRIKAVLRAPLPSMTTPWAHLHVSEGQVLLLGRREGQEEGLDRRRPTILKCDLIRDLDQLGGDVQLPLDLLVDDVPVDGVL